MPRAARNQLACSERSEACRNDLDPDGQNESPGTLSRSATSAVNSAIQPETVRRVKSRSSPHLSAICRQPTMCAVAPAGRAGGVAPSR